MAVSFTSDVQEEVRNLKEQLAELQKCNTQLLSEFHLLATGASKSELTSEEAGAFARLRERELAQLESEKARLKKLCDQSGNNLHYLTEFGKVARKVKEIKRDLESRVEKPQTLEQRISHGDLQKLQALKAREQELLVAYGKTGLQDRELCSQHAAAKTEARRFENQLARSTGVVGQQQ